MALTNYTLPQDEIDWLLPGKRSIEALKGKFGKGKDENIYDLVLLLSNISRTTSSCEGRFQGLETGNISDFEQSLVEDKEPTILWFNFNYHWSNKDKVSLSKFEGSKAKYAARYYIPNVIFYCKKSGKKIFDQLYEYLLCKERYLLRHGNSVKKFEIPDEEQLNVTRIYLGVGLPHLLTNKYRPIFQYRLLNFQKNSPQKCSDAIEFDLRMYGKFLKNLTGKVENFMIERDYILNT